MNNKPYKEIAKISPEERETIRRKTAYSLPDDPSARGMRPDQVRKRFWEAIAGDKSSIFEEIDRLAAETNTALDALWMMLYGTVEIDGEAVGIADLIKTGLAQGYTLADLFEGLASGDALRLIHEKTTGKNLQQCLDDLGKLDLTAKVAPISGGHRVTLTDKNGERYFDVMDGETGIHIGPEAPTDGQVAWIDTNEEPSAEEGGANFDIVAKPGQVIAVKAVDVEGKPKEYKAVDLPVHDAPDWNAAEGAAGHVLNRTHYVDEKGVVHKLPNKFIDADWMATKKDGGAGETVFIAEQTVVDISIVEGNKIQAALVEGDVYAVEVNGELYKCACYIYDGLFCLGNGTLIGGTESNNEPFCVTWTGGTATRFMFHDDGTLETPIGIKVSDWEDDAYNTLPKEYMPEISWNDVTDKPISGDVGELLFSHTATFATDDTSERVTANDLALTDGAEYWLEVNGDMVKCRCEGGGMAWKLYDSEGNMPMKRGLGYIYIYGKTAGTYTYKLYDLAEKIVLAPNYIPSNIARKSDIPTGGGSASIDVTAQVGQTIIVKEVDADGKPTKWESADYQPRTHYKGIVELYNATLTGLAESEALIEGFSMQAGETYYITWNGVEYTCVCVEVPDMGGACYIGNGSALELEDTGEPFTILYGTEDGVNFFTIAISLDGVDETTVVIKGTGYIPIPREYLTNAFPYYIEVAGSGADDNPYVCNETVAEVEALFDSGRTVCVRNRIYVDGGLILEACYTFCYRIKETENGYTICFMRVQNVQNQPVQRLTLYPQSDGSYTIETKAMG